MKQIDKVGAQGDVFFVRVEKMPSAVAPKVATAGQHIVAHSETGHHHAVRADGAVLYEGPADPFTCYLQVTADFADIVHHRDFDTHETLRLPQGIWMVRRQREHTPEGFRRVED